MTNDQTTNDSSPVATVLPDGSDAKRVPRDPASFYREMRSRLDVRAVLTELAAHERDFSHTLLPDL